MIIQSKFTPRTPGVFRDVPMREYQSAPGLSKSALEHFDICPQAFHRRADFKRETAAMSHGTIFGALVLEGKKEFHTHPDRRSDGSEWHWAAKECKEWRAAHQGLPAVSESEAAQLAHDALAVSFHPVAAPVLHNTEREVSMFAEYGGRLIKGRADVFAETYCADLKTVADASDAALSRAILNYNWHVQAGLYWKLATLNGFKHDKFYIIAVQRDPVLMVNVKQLAPAAMELGLSKFDSWLDRLTECERTGQWPDYCYGKIGTIDVPEWAYQQEEELELIAS